MPYQISDKWRTRTRWFIGITTLVIAAYDVWAWLNGKPGDTISEIALAFSYDNVVLLLWWGFGFGLLAGHLFVPMVLRVIVAPPQTKEATTPTVESNQ